MDRASRKPLHVANRPTRRGASLPRREVCLPVNKMTPEMGTKTTGVRKKIVAPVPKPKYANKAKKCITETTPDDQEKSAPSALSKQAKINAQNKRIAGKLDAKKITTPTQSKSHLHKEKKGVILKVACEKKVAPAVIPKPGKSQKNGVPAVNKRPLGVGMKKIPAVRVANISNLPSFLDVTFPDVSCIEPVCEGSILISTPCVKVSEKYKTKPTIKVESKRKPEHILELTEDMSIIEKHEESYRRISCFIDDEKLEENADMKRVFCMLDASNSFTWPHPNSPVSHGETILNFINDEKIEDNTEMKQALNILDDSSSWLHPVPKQSDGECVLKFKIGSCFDDIDSTAQANEDTCRHFPLSYCGSLLGPPQSPPSHPNEDADLITFSPP